MNHTVSRLQHVVLGLDGGGTKTDTVVACSGPAFLGHARSGPCNLAASSLKVCLRSAVDSAQVALKMADRSEQDVVSICAGVAGASYIRRSLRFKAGLRKAFPNAHVEIVPDYVVALYGALTCRPGVIVIAGTGSVAFGDDGAGHTSRAGAYGYLIDDSGSGYGVGRRALAAVMQAADGTGEQTSLTERVLWQLKLRNISEIVPAVYGNRVDRLAIASLAEVTARCANDDNDIVAAALLVDAGTALAHLALPVLQTLFAAEKEPVPVARTGSLWNSGKFLEEKFTSQLARGSVPFHLMDAAASPAIGAAHRALLLNVNVFHELS